MRFLELQSQLWNKCEAAFGINKQYEIRVKYNISKVNKGLRDILWHLKDSPCEVHKIHFILKMHHNELISRKCFSISPLQPVAVKAVCSCGP